VSTPRIALIGCGAVAETYYVPALRKRPELLRSLILVDPDLGRASALRGRLGALDAVADYREALPRVSGALVLTPHRLHHRISLDCLRQGIAVLCEKPLAETPGEVDEIIEASRIHAAPVLVNHTRRLFPSHRAVRGLIEAGALGELREIHYELGAPFEWPAATPTYFGAKSGGRGVLFDTGVHVIDLVCWWLGGEPQVLDYADDSRGGTEAVARVTVQRGAIEARMHFSWLSKLGNAYRVVGSRASVEGGAYDWSSYTIIDGRRRRKERTDRSWRVYEHFVEQLIDNFVAVMAHRAEPLVTAADVRPAIAVIDACYGRRAPLAEPWHDAWQRLFPDERRVANG
jgi:predicted dehydrogenase